MLIRAALVGLASLALIPAPPRAGAEVPGQEVAVPVDVHLPILVKILNFDRNLPTRVAGQVTIGVLYQAGYRISARTAQDAEAVVKGLPTDILGGFPIEAVLIDLDAAEDLDAALVQRQVHVLYVTPLRAVDLTAVTRATRTARIPSLTGVPTYVEDGVAVGVDNKGGRPQIVVNIPASRSEGADFSSQLLKLARVIGR